MRSMDEEFRIRAPTSTLHIPTNPGSHHHHHGLPTPSPDGAVSHVDPVGGPTTGDPRYVPTFTVPGAASSTSSDALAHRLANFEEGRRLKNAAQPTEAAAQTEGEMAPPLPPQQCPGEDTSNGWEANVSTRRPPRPHKVTARSEYRPLTAEDDEGDVEYKWRLTGISALRFEHLVTQMKFRVSEGQGQCLYELGVADNGVVRGLPSEDFAESVDTIQRMARTLGLDCTLLQECVVQRAPVPLYCGELLVSRRHARGQDLSLCFCGSLGSGKSTLMGALLTSALDDGHGSTRQSLFNHKHEIDSGRTTSIATRVWTVHCVTASAAGAAADELLSDTEVEVSVVVEEKGHGEDSLGGGGKLKGDGSSNSSVSFADSSAHSPTHADGDTHPSNETEDAASNRETNIPTDGSAECLPSSCSDDTAAASPTGDVPRDEGCVFGAAFAEGERGERMMKKKEKRRKPRLISLMDVGGDITKTSLFGLMSRKPDYVCLCIAADTAAESVTLYAQVCCAIGTPFLVAVTKVDTVEDFELDGFCMDVAATLRNTAGCVCDVVESEETALAYCRTWLPQHRDGAVHGGLEEEEGGAEYVKPAPRVPLFCVSSVTGAGLGLLKFTVAHLPRLCASVPMTPLSASTRPSFEVLLDYAFQVKGVGPVVRGRVSSGAVEVGCACYVGPNETGAFFPVVLRGIHVDGAHVNEAQLGDEATFALDRLPPTIDLAHKGKVLVRQPRSAVSAFRLTVRVLSQSLTNHLEPILYSRNARQAIRVVSCLPRTPVFRPSPLGSAAAAVVSPTGTRDEELEVECEFLFRPEVLTYDAPVVLRWEPKGIAVGKVSLLGLSNQHPLPS